MVRWDAMYNISFSETSEGLLLERYSLIYKEHFEILYDLKMPETEYNLACKVVK